MIVLTSESSKGVTPPVVSLHRLFRSAEAMHIAL